MSHPYDRLASEPGGCDCHECGVIFVGAEWHTLCAVCDSRLKREAPRREARLGPKGESGGAEGNRHKAALLTLMWVATSVVFLWSTM